MARSLNKQDRSLLIIKILLKLYSTFFLFTFQNFKGVIDRNFLNSFTTEAGLQSKSMDWFLYENGLGHERVNNW